MPPKFNDHPMSDKWWCTTIYQILLLFWCLKPWRRFLPFFQMRFKYYSKYWHYYQRTCSVSPEKNTLLKFSNPKITSLPLKDPKKSSNSSSILPNTSTVMNIHSSNHTSPPTSPSKINNWLRTPGSSLKNATRKTITLINFKNVSWIGSAVIDHPSEQPWLYGSVFLTTR